MFYDIENIFDLDSQLRFKFHQILFLDTLNHTTHWSSKWMINIRHCTQNDLLQIEKCIGSNFLHGKIGNNGRLTGYVVFENIREDIEVNELCFPYLNAYPLKCIVLGEYEKLIAKLPGLDISFGNRQLVDNIFKSESGKFSLNKLLKQKKTSLMTK